MSPSDRSGVRASLRQAARSLPAPAQLWLKRVDAAVLGTDIVEPIRQLRLRESALIDETIARARHLPGRRRILMLTLQTPSPWSETEGGLAMALALRGHDVRGILCDGLLPVCEMNLGPHDRPDCAVCVGWRARTYEGAFGFAWPRLSRHLSDGDVEEAGAIVDRTSAADRRRLMVDGVPVGRFARRELQRYYRGFVDDPSVDPAYRPWLVSGVLMVRLLSRVLEAERPDLVVASSGRTLASASLVALAPVPAMTLMRSRQVSTDVWISFLCSA